MPSSVSAS